MSAKKSAKSQLPTKEFKIISPTDASILAALAQHPNASAARRTLFVKALGEEGKRIAQAMKPHGKPLAPSEEATATADAVKKWALANNRKIAVHQSVLAQLMNRPTRQVRIGSSGPKKSKSAFARKKK